MKRRSLPVLITAVSLGLVFGWWRFGTRYTPEGQPPLATVDASSMEALKGEFNRAAGETRIILLLSPT